MKNKIIKNGIRTVLVASSLAYFFYYLYQHYNNLPNLSWNLSVAVGLMGGTLLYCLNILTGGVVWNILLKNYNINISWIDSIHIVSFSQFGKYIPGNIGQHIGRVVFAKAKGIPTATTLQTIFIEAIVLSIVGVLISIIGFYFFQFKGFYNSELLLVQIIFFALVLLCLPKILFSIINKLVEKRFLKFALQDRLVIPKFDTLILITILHITMFINLGIILNLIARVVLGSPENHIFFLITAFSWSWILGYLAPGAPAGLGIREAVLVASLSMRFDPAIAIGLSIILRFITTIGDGFVFLIALAFKYRLPKVKTDHITDPSKKSN
ncbi:UPF0104 family protein [Leptospira selangorensis]|uniref:UPF0104 family protein n=1 Tax=Leptospira selangorensis TaxID=2484982 RepID=A0A5F2BVM7_9LEPT|nr:lysylphosphatidylglycerol synthase transmembrane domain-containing protein [Leptospira selangorensis]TGM11970.1 UPF0104 family protein [Leptospira selangorensis]TGM15169.1 UPF0104 family protein [Leptospira selangorensis]